MALAHGHRAVFQGQPALIHCWVAANRRHVAVVCCQMAVVHISMAVTRGHKAVKHFRMAVAHVHLAVTQRHPAAVHCLMAAVHFYLAMTHFHMEMSHRQLAVSHGHMATALPHHHILPEQGENCQFTCIMNRQDAKPRRNIFNHQATKVRGTVAVCKDLCSFVTLWFNLTRQAYSLTMSLRWSLEMLGEEVYKFTALLALGNGIQCEDAKTSR